MKIADFSYVSEKDTRKRRPIIEFSLSFRKSGSLNLMDYGDLRILTESSEIAVSVHLQWLT